MTPKRKRKSTKSKKRLEDENVETEDHISTLWIKIKDFISFCIRKLMSIVSGLLILLNENPVSRSHRQKKNQNINIQFKSSILMENQLIGPRKSLNLVLDLEGTLMRSSLKQWKDSYDQEIIKLRFQNGSETLLFVRWRPFLKEFLEDISKYYNIFIFTARTKEYADPIIDRLGVPASNRYYRDIHNYLLNR